MTEKRLDKIREVAFMRQTDITVILNNVHDPHNLGAVLRTCDSVGIPEIFVLYNEEGQGEENLLLGKKAAASARKWVDVYLYTDTEKCFNDIRSKYKKIIGTHLGSDSVSLYSVDFCDSMALVFGNEHSGISDSVMTYLDGNFIIPQVGMVQSLNISVSVAITLYEAYRQRQIAGKYFQSVEDDSNLLVKSYIERHRDPEYGKLMIRKD
ncbi:MAG: TrmH family RNA methyltransferase [Deltaproteobacteria bacterium]